MWYLYAMEFYLSISKNEVIEFAGKKKIKAENTILSEVTQTQRDKCCVFSLIHGS